MEKSKFQERIFLTLSDHTKENSLAQLMLKSPIGLSHKILECLFTNQLDDLKNAKYIALETFRKNGEGVITPVWAAGANGKLYVWTGANSWKVKRIKNDKLVRLCESDARGNPKSDWVQSETFHG